MACYICDPERTRSESLAMPEDEWNEGCEDCFSAFVDAFILPNDDEDDRQILAAVVEAARTNPQATAGNA